MIDHLLAITGLAIPMVGILFYIADTAPDGVEIEGVGFVADSQLLGHNRQPSLHQNPARVLNAPLPGSQAKVGANQFHDHGDMRD